MSIEFLGNAFTEPAYRDGLRLRTSNAATTDFTGNLAPSIAGDFIGFGDFDNDQRLTAVDIGLLSLVEKGQHDLRFDVNGDGAVGAAGSLDLYYFVVSQGLSEYMEYGDSDLNGWFDSSDLILVFQAGEYEDGVNGNSSWSTGDWDGDGEFDSYVTSCSRSNTAATAGISCRTA
ncbi:MAG: hypothetical protein R3C28_13105 [Pirellulaceae bacterium]